MIWKETGKHLSTVHKTNRWSIVRPQRSFLEELVGTIALHSYRVVSVNHTYNKNYNSIQKDNYLLCYMSMHFVYIYTHKSISYFCSKHTSSILKAINTAFTWFATKSHPTMSIYLLNHCFAIGRLTSYSIV